MVRSSWRFWSDGLMDRRMDKGSHACNFSLVGIPWTCTPKIIVLGNLDHGQKLLRVLMRFTWVTDGRTKGVMRVILLPVGIPWTCTPKTIVLGNLDHGQKLLRVLVGWTWVTDRQTKMVMRVILFLVGILVTGHFATGHLATGHFAPGYLVTGLFVTRTIRY